MRYVLACFGVQQASVNASKEFHLGYSPPNRHGKGKVFFPMRNYPRSWSITKQFRPTIGLVQFINRIIRRNEKCEPFAWRRIGAETGKGARA